MRYNWSIVAFYLSNIVDIINGLYSDDCWSKEYMNRIKISAKSDPSKDSGLSEFTNMLKCLNGRSRAGNDMQGMVGLDNRLDAQSMINMNNVLKKLGSQQSNVNYGNHHILGGKTDRAGNQPVPGVHPDDWRTVNQPINREQNWNTDASRRRIYYNTVMEKNNWNNQNSKQNTNGGRMRINNSNFQQMRRRLNNVDNVSRNRGEPSTSERDDQRLRLSNVGGQTSLQKLANGNKLTQKELESSTKKVVNKNFGDLDSSPSVVRVETPPLTPAQSVALLVNRKYGYAIMASSLVVLAVLVISTMFCCGSSSQRATQAERSAAAATQAALLASYDPTSTMVVGSGGGDQPLISTNKMHNFNSLYANGTISESNAPINPYSESDDGRKYREAMASGLRLDAATMAAYATTHSNNTMNSTYRSNTPQYRISDLHPDYNNHDRRN